MKRDRGPSKTCETEDCIRKSGQCRLCAICRGVDTNQVCACGRYSGPAKTCGECRGKTGYPCVKGCGRKSRSSGLCAVCSGVGRNTCLECGSSSGTSTTCGKCSFIKKHGVEGWNSYQVAKSARRRALRLKAKVDDVPWSYYATLRKQNCSYCGKAGGQVDHIVPLARGGAESFANLAPACRDCNLSKGNKLLEEWLI